MGEVRRMGMERPPARFVLMITAVFVVACTAYVAWSQHGYESSVEDKALAEARTLNTEIMAAWDYVSASQNAINYNSDGKYDFKGIYCAAAGKSIASRFTTESEGYVIRYVRENPRITSGIPDEFEQAALDRFELERVSEHYAVAEYEGRRVFRYASVLVMERNCLGCHGSPVGEKDEMGFLKEGMELGDIGGAASIVIPLEQYEEQARASMRGGIAFFSILLLVVLASVNFGYHRWVSAPIRQANEVLRKENEAKSDFLALMSHELRTPLASIMAFSDILSESAELRGEQERKAVREIGENSLVLLNMVNNTIDAAKIEAGRYSVAREEVDVFDVVNEVFDLMEPSATKRGVSLRKSLAADIPILACDYDALRKILVNLVGNAVKYSENGSAVVVRASYSPDAEGRLAVSVSDTGRGIAPEDQKRIFDRFERGSAQATSVSGSGLGLFLVKSICDELGGDVTVESKLGEGSTFTVTLPARSCEDGQ